MDDIPKYVKQRVNDKPDRDVVDDTTPSMRITQYEKQNGEK